MGMDLLILFSVVVVSFKNKPRSGMQLTAWGMDPLHSWHWGFAAAGFGMLLSLVIYLAGARYLPAEAARRGAARAARPPLDRAARDRFALLIGIAAIVVIFRGAYEQVGNTIALWADSGVDREIAAGWTIPMTWFQALDSLIVFAFTPLLVARWARTHGPFAADGRDPARRLGLLPAQVAPVLRTLVAAGRLYEGEFRPGGTGVELCDPEVLRLIRRDTLARLRNEVAPVDAAVLGRFLPRWHGIGSARGGVARLREAIDQLEGIALPFSELERVILPARVPDFQPRMLDELGAAGEVVWVGQGAIGSDDGRVILYRREHVASLFDVPAAPELPTELHAAILKHLAERGASFVAQLPEAASRPDSVVAALWDLAWLGLVTNDTFAPLRTLGRTSRGPRGRFTLPAGGRWSTLASVVGAPPADTVRAHTRALMLLERYGVVSREAAAAESLTGGFASVSGVLRAMEESGKIRRGHFVDGLQGAQFAHAAAVDRLRAARDADADAAGPPVVVLSAIDPANPYGAILPWPTEGARRAAGAKVVLAHGEPVFFVERGGKKLRLLAPVDDALLPAALAALKRIAAARRHRQLRIEEVDGVPALHSPHAPLLERGGFRIEPGALVLSADD